MRRIWFIGSGYFCKQQCNFDVKRLTCGLGIHTWVKWGIWFSMAGLVVACTPVNRSTGPVALNSRYTDEQPALSGNGRLLAFVSNRNGSRQIWLYDLQQRQFVDVPRLNRQDAIAENPSLSQNGRYIVYIASDQGRPEVELYDRSTKSSQILTMGYRGWVRNPSISPDGRYIAFESSSRGQWDVEVLDRGPNIELDIPDGSPSASP
ncbi:TolB family protein [Coleofasciculus sp. FACHB-542]|nr:TolB family protein [Coleofasciculus sp. FACHB-542]